LKQKNTKFLKDTKAKLNFYSNDLKEDKTPSKEDINKEKMKKIKLCLSEVLEFEGNLHQSIIELNFAQKFCVNEEEKDIKIKIQKIISKFYNSNENKLFKGKNFSKTLSQISSFIEFGDNISCLLDLNNLYDFASYYKEICKKDLSYEKDILNKFRDHIIKDFKLNCINNRIKLEDIELIYRYSSVIIIFYYLFRFFMLKKNG